MTLKGENGLMRKRFSGLEKALEEQKAELRRLHGAQDGLYTTIAAHEKDMQAYKEARRRRRRRCRCRCCACACAASLAARLRGRAFVPSPARARGRQL